MTTPSLSTKPAPVTATALKSSRNGVRKPRRPRAPQNDAELVRSIVLALIEGGGRGMLTHVAAQIGLPVSACRKRLFLSKNAFDEPTMRAYILVTQAKAGEGEPLSEEQRVDGLTVGRRADGSAAWRVAA